MIMCHLAIYTCTKKNRGLFIKPDSTDLDAIKFFSDWINGA